MHRCYLLLASMGLGLVFGVARAEPLVYERFEKSAAGTARGINYSTDVVGYGGLIEPNLSSAAFDGQPSTAVDLGPSKKLRSTDFTVEAFVKLAEQRPFQAIAADWSEDGKNRAWALVVLYGGALRFDVSPDGDFHADNILLTAPRLLQPGQWYHVAAVSQGDTSRIYVNGREVAQKKRPKSGILSTGIGSLKLGNADRYAGAPAPLCGLLDEVRITPLALAPAGFLKTKGPMPEVPAPPVPRRYAMPFTATDKAEATAWQERARTKLLELVQRQTPRSSLEKVPLDVKLDPPLDKGDYTLHAITFQGNSKEPGRFPGLLAIPKGQGPFPAMLALHGHGGSAQAVFDTKSIYHGFADRFARGGYVVFAPSFPHRKYAAMTLWDLFRAVEILRARPEVDRERIGVGGLSMGGEFTMWIATCDPRLKVAVVSGWMCTTDGVFSVPNCPCWELPGFVDLMDVCEVNLLIAPRPVVFESAEYDGCFPIRYTKEGYGRIRAGYKVFGAEDAARQDIWPAGHEWHGVVAYPVVDRVLGGHAAKTKEKN